MSVQELRRDFFEGYLERQPEEAFTLGRYEGASRLRDHRPEALEDERRWYRAMGQRLDALDEGELTSAEAIDRSMMKRVVNHHLHGWDALFGRIDWLFYPAAMTSVQWVHAETPADRRAIAGRLAAMPAFLEQHRACVEAAMAEGQPVDGALCGFLSEHQLPPAEAFFRERLAPQPEIGEAAVDAADALAATRAWLQDRIAPHATDEAPRIGEEEVRWRLREQLALDDDIDRHLARAHGELLRVHEATMACAAKLDARLTRREELLELTGRLQQARIASDAEIIPTYRALVDRTLEHLRQGDAFRLPEPYRIGIEHLPPGFSAASHAGNWPAPLLDGSKLGHFMVASEASAHSLAWAADLAVHEGLPGHHLQSYWWQHHFGDDPAPVRFLLVHDHVAAPRQFWGAMPNIEGYAVYAEERMRRDGFFAPEEELFVLMAHGIRAARVIVDLSLHAGRMTEAEAHSFLSTEGGMTAGQATMEVRRYLQIPLQACTYLLGRLAIEDLAQTVAAAEGAAFDEARFHERFFSFGPADPASIQAAWLD